MPKSKPPSIYDSRQKCTKCLLTFSCEKQLKEHTCRKKIHVCNLCGFKCRLKSGLTSHLQAHRNKMHGKLTCEFCEGKFKNESTLRVHTSYYHSERANEVDERLKAMNQGNDFRQIEMTRQPEIQPVNTPPYTNYPVLNLFVPFCRFTEPVQQYNTESDAIPDISNYYNEPEH